MRPLNRDGFEIAIICALALEADAVEALFDKPYDKFGQIYGRQSGDKNAYITGKIGQHNVVLCYLPGIGKSSAAAAAVNLRISYTRIQLALVVGICGGVPFPSSKAEIRLGDVIISDSVIEYDFGWQYPDGFRRKSGVKETLGRPNPEVRAFLAALKSRKMQKELQGRIYWHLQTLQAQPGTEWQYPGIAHDVLFDASYRHRHYQRDPDFQCICFDCDSNTDLICDDAVNRDCNSLGCTGELVHRYGSQSTNPSVYIGTIASADTVMKSGEHRNKIAEREGVIGFEMEGAGVWDNIPCIIIKGVCDYADSHKNKIWQDYAAATAASGVKAFLEYWVSSSSETMALNSKSVHPDMAAHLQIYYNAGKRLQIQRISGEILPMDQCYINISIVEQEHSIEGNNDCQTSPSSICDRLKVDVVDKDRQISLSQLFASRTQSDGTKNTPKRILIQGRAGVGKTTLCKKIVYDHLHHELWGHLFELLLWVPLRRLKGMVQGKYTIVDVFHDLYFSELEHGKDLAKNLWESINDPIKKTKILLILDGLDEVSQEWDPETPMNNILLRLLDHPQVIITSRPYGINLGRLESFDLELETIGFNENQVEAYITKVVKHDPKKADAILAFIRKHALIQGLFRIPIQLDALCYSWDNSFMTEDEPKTMTTLYHAITLRLLQKDILQLGKTGAIRGLNEYKIRALRASEIHQLVPDEINLLENLAFAGLCNEIIEFNANDRHRIYDSLKRRGTVLPTAPDTMLIKTSFLHTSDTAMIDQDRSYHFLHLTFQEFFAARYFARRWMKDEQLLCVRLRQRSFDHFLMSPRAFLQQEKYNSRYDILWRFTAGLLQGVAGDEQETEESMQRYFQELEAEPRDLLGPVHQRLLIHCLGEVIPDTESNRKFRKEIEIHITHWLQFECYFHQAIWLGREREFPDHLLEAALQGPVNLKNWVLTALDGRQNLSTHLLEALGRLLKDDNSCVRYGATRVLGQQSALPKKILESLIQYLKDNISNGWMSAAFEASTLSKEVLEVLTQLLKDDDSDVRSETILILRKQVPLPKEILQTLLQLLLSDSSNFRLGVAQVLDLQSALPREILEALSQLLKDENLSIRLEAAHALGYQSALSKETLETLMQLVKDNNSNPHIRYEATRALGRQSTLPKGILEELGQLLNDPDVRILAVQVLGQQSALPKEILETLVKLLNPDGQDIRHYAAEALGKQLALPKEILEALGQLLNNPGVRTLAVQALGQQSALPKEILETLVKLLNDNSHSQTIRLYAAQALEKQLALPKEMLEAVSPVLKDNDPLVQYRATQALGRQSALPKETLEVLVQLLKDGNKNVSAGAAQALKHQSSLPKDILEALVPLLAYGSANVEAKAESTLRNHSKFYHMLPLNAQYFTYLYNIWLERSFRDQVSCCFRGTTLYIDTPEGLWKLPLEKKTAELFKRQFEAVQMFWGVPSCCYPREKKRGSSRMSLRLISFLSILLMVLILVTTNSSSTKYL